MSKNRTLIELTWLLNKKNARIMTGDTENGYCHGVDAMWSKRNPLFQEKRNKEKNVYQLCRNAKLENRTWVELDAVGRRIYCSFETRKFRSSSSRGKWRMNVAELIHKLASALRPAKGTFFVTRASCFKLPLNSIFEYAVHGRISSSAGASSESFDLRGYYKPWVLI